MDLKSEPRIIYQNFRSKQIDKAYAINLLISIIQNSSNVNLRTRSLDFLLKVEPSDEKIFHLLENLFISDSDEEIRRIAGNMLRILFQEKAIEPMR